MIDSQIDQLTKILQEKQEVAQMQLTLNRQKLEQLNFKAILNFKAKEFNAINFRIQNVFNSILLLSKLEANSADFKKWFPDNEDDLKEKLRGIDFEGLGSPAKEKVIKFLSKETLHILPSVDKNISQLAEVLLDQIRNFKLLNFIQVQLSQLRQFSSRPNRFDETAKAIVESSLQQSSTSDENELAQKACKTLDELKVNLSDVNVFLFKKIRELASERKEVGDFFGRIRHYLP